MSTTDAINRCRAVLSAPPVPWMDLGIDRAARALLCVALLAEVSR